MQTTLNTTANSSQKTKKATLFTTAILALGILAAVPAQAQESEDPRFYLNLINGVNQTSGTTVTIDGNESRLSFDTGYVGGLGFGYKLGKNLAVEAEIFYRTNDFDGLNPSGVNLAPSGTLASLSGFGNLVWSATYLSERFTPYVGVGVGYIEEIDADLGFIGAGNTEVSGNGAAWQAKAGVDIALSKNWALDVGARFMDAGSVTMTGAPGDLDLNYRNWSATLGIKWRF